MNSFEKVLKGGNLTITEKMFQEVPHIVPFSCYLGQGQSCAESAIE